MQTYIEKRLPDRFIQINKRIVDFVVHHLTALSPVIKPSYARRIFSAGNLC